MTTVVQIAALATGLGLPTTPSSGAHQMPRAGANQVAKIVMTHLKLQITLMAVPALT